jgi:acyl-CoA dehydrogenase
MEIDLQLSPEEIRFRDEVRIFLAEELDPELRRAAELTSWWYAEFAYGVAWQKKLHARGWGAPYWPAEYGGSGWTATQLLIWEVENARARPPAMMDVGKFLVGPCLMHFGTDAQKAEFLPKILSGDDWWCQGYSEPGAGSDLAALQLSAKRIGDDYVLNGSKIWTSLAQHCNRCMVLVRTDSTGRKQEGISVLLVDLDSPGIEIRPILNIAGEHEFNEIFFSDVHVPVSRLLGQENEGWSILRHSLLFEHGAGKLSESINLRWRIDWISEIARLEPDGFGGFLVDEPDFVRRLAILDIRVQAIEVACLQALHIERATGLPSAVEALLNVRIRELCQEISQLAVEAVGYGALPDQIAARTVLDPASLIGPERALMPMPFFLAQRARTIAGGTAEVHRNNIAKQLLRT